MCGRLRSETKQVIESRDPENPARRQAQPAGDFFEQRRRKVPVDLLRGMQNLNERVTRVVVTRHGVFERLPAAGGQIAHQSTR